MNRAEAATACFDGHPLPSGQDAGDCHQCAEDDRAADARMDEAEASRECAGCGVRLEPAGAPTHAPWCAVFPAEASR